MGPSKFWPPLLSLRTAPPPRPFSICQFCWVRPFANHLRLFEAPVREQWLNDKGVIEVDGGYSYTTSWPELESRALAGCTWCNMLLSLREASSPSTQHSARQSRRVKITIGRHDGMGDVCTPPSTQDFVIFLDNVRAIWGHVYAAADNPAASFIVARPRILDVGSSRTLQLARTCLDDCMHGHPRCILLHSSSNTRLPTRLIDCADADRPRLLSTIGQRGIYVALSYVWGEDQPHSTTTANISDYESGIDGAVLPQTIRDAIYVTHALGMRYLWADTLCIIQDSAEDKSRELGYMHEIYRYAHLTIVAASARKVSDGFLEPRRPASDTTEDGITLPELTLPFPVSLPPSRAASKRTNASHTSPPRQPVGEVHISPIYMSAYGWVHLKPDSLSAEPISARAWCMQEFQMSPRVLFFGTETLRFRCLSSTRNVGDSFLRGPLLAREQHVLPDMLFLRDPPQLALPSDPDADSTEWARLHGKWGPLVQDYTRRTVSYPSDKLVACSAMAAAFQRVLRADYLAGLWRPTLLMDLLWHRAREGARCLPRPRCWYRAPSWSWAAIDGPVDANMSTVESLLAVVVQCEVVLKDATLRFGEVKGGFLVLHAALIPCTRGPPVDEAEEGAGRYRLHLHSAADGDAQPRDMDSLSKFAGEVRFDSEDDIEVATMSAIPIRLDDEYIDGLVVVAVPDKLASRSWLMPYRRVGYFRIYEEKLYNLGWKIAKLPLVDFELI
ncbi:heterokaryon incompatibility protein-domain-containing protein [Trametes gibbosa]|nr:heterokaryon incompatibility protein-domain-containing protein [Trametes gibbosa]